MSALTQNNEGRTGSQPSEGNWDHRGLKTEPETHCTYDALGLSPSLIESVPRECAYPSANTDHSNLFTRCLSAALDMLVQIQKAVPPQATATGTPGNQRNPR